MAHKCAQHPEIFTELVLASRTKEKCDRLAQAVEQRTGYKNIVTDRVDADKVPELVELFNRHKPDICINVALPYQDLTIMDACLECGVNYLDTANYEPLDEAHLNIRGNGPIANALRKRVSRPYWAAASTPA